MPTRLPDETAKRIRKYNTMTSTERQFILRWMSYTMENMNLTTDEDYVNVCTLAVNRYPQLQFKASGVVCESAPPLIFSRLYDACESLI